jgi:hypothetical protein
MPSSVSSTEQPSTIRNVSRVNLQPRHRKRSDLQLLQATFWKASIDAVLLRQGHRKTTLQWNVAKMVESNQPYGAGLTGRSGCLDTICHDQHTSIEGVATSGATLYRPADRRLKLIFDHSSGSEAKELSVFATANGRLAAS